MLRGFEYYDRNDRNTTKPNISFINNILRRLRHDIEVAPTLAPLKIRSKF